MLLQSSHPIDIIDDILKRPDALDTYLGKEVHDFLFKEINSLKAPSLLKIDLKKANPIDYLFTKSAFGEIYKIVNNSAELDCVFFINKSQAKHLFWGLLANMDGNIHRNGDHELDFKANYNIKVCYDPYDIQFIGTLTKSEGEILKFINSKEVTEDDAIHSAFSNSISHGDISTAINSLKTKKFIYCDESGIPNKIYSINSIIREK